jgi:hypothetical protein
MMLLLRGFHWMASKAVVTHLPTHSPLDNFTLSMFPMNVQLQQQQQQQQEEQQQQSVATLTT